MATVDEVGTTRMKVEHRPPSTDMEDIQISVYGCISYWQQNHHPHHQTESTKHSSNNSDIHTHNIGSFCPYMHAQCSVIQIVPQSMETNIMGNPTSTSYTTTNGSLYKLPPDITFDISSLRILKSINKDEPSIVVPSLAGVVSVQIVSDNHLPQSPVISGWIVLLKNRLDQWQCISGAISVAQSSPLLPNQTMVVQPTDIQDVMECVWDGYCMANRACDGIKMAQVFHETCRLTYVADDSLTPPKTNSVDNDVIVDVDDGIRVINCKSFCDKVTNRYKTEAAHIPYAHLQNDPLVSSCDEIIGIEFAENSPNVAMVLLKIGHPPCLWTDALTCAKLGNKWFIVHKSSTNAPFLTHLAHVNMDEL
jgi:hypothetical protein